MKKQTFTEGYVRNASVVITSCELWVSVFETVCVCFVRVYVCKSEGGVFCGVCVCVCVSARRVIK